MSDLRVMLGDRYEAASEGIARAVSLYDATATATAAADTGDVS